jgi:hypothetical protein
VSMMWGAAVEATSSVPQCGGIAAAGVAALCGLPMGTIDVALASVRVGPGTLTGGEATSGLMP